MRLLLINPNTSVAITAQLARAARACAAPGTEVLEATGAFGAEVIASREAAAVGAHAALDALQREQRGGRPFDAVLLAISLDCGLAALRAHSAVPVVGLSEAALLRAAALAERAALVTLGRAMQPLYEEMVAGYGLAAQVPWVRATELTAPGFRADPAQGLGQLRALIDEVQAAGAGAVVLAGAVLAGHAPALQRDCAVQLVDAIPAAVARAEALAAAAAGAAAAGARRASP